MDKKISDKVKKGEILAFIYANDEEKGNQAVEDLLWDFCDNEGIELSIDEMDILIEQSIKTAMSRY